MSERRFVDNLFACLPVDQTDEVFDMIVDEESCRIERIVSRGHTTPPGTWYDQRRDEWVVVLRGSARLVFEDPPRVLEMGVGDHVRIPAHCRHRVEWTDPGEETVWLAVHFGDPDGPDTMS